MEAKTHRNGHFVWRELLTTDVAKARAFYGELFGWSWSENPMPQGGTYFVAKTPGTEMIAGMMATPPGAPPMTAWMTYLSVADVDKSVHALKQHGGKVLMGPMDAMGMRFATVQDPTGAVFGLLHNGNGDGALPERPATSTFCWESLNTTDVKKASAFYQHAFGHSETAGPDGKMPMLKAGETQVADMGNAPPGVPSHWLSHVVVENLAQSRARAEKLGAKILMADIPVPTIGNLCIIQDPTGGTLSLFQPAPRA